MTLQPKFTNEPLLDFSEAHTRHSVTTALRDLESRIAAGSLVARPILRGEQIRGKTSFARTDPSDHTAVIGTVEFADTTTAEEAIRICLDGLDGWRLQV